MSFDRCNKKYQQRKQSAADVEKLNRKKRTETKEKKLRLSLLKKGCFVNKTTQNIQATSNASNPDINTDITRWIEESSSEEEYIKCSRKSHVGTVNEEIKGRSSEQEDIGILKSRRKSRVEITDK